MTDKELYDELLEIHRKYEELLERRDNDLKSETASMSTDYFMMMESEINKQSIRVRKALRIFSDQQAVYCRMCKKLFSPIQKTEFSSAVSDCLIHQSFVEIKDSDE